MFCGGCQCTLTKAGGGGDQFIMKLSHGLCMTKYRKVFIKLRATTDDSQGFMTLLRHCELFTLLFSITFLFTEGVQCQCPGSIINVSRMALTTY